MVFIVNIIHFLLVAAYLSLKPFHLGLQLANNPIFLLDTRLQTLTLPNKRIIPNPLILKPDNILILIPKHLGESPNFLIHECKLLLILGDQPFIFFHFHVLFS